MSVLRPADYDRSMPCNPDAERMILGVILLDNSVLCEAAAKLQPEDFYTPSNKTVWQGMLRLAARHSGVDPLTLQYELDAETLDRIGGPAYIASR